MSNRHSPEISNFVHEPPSSAPSSQDGESILNTQKEAASLANNNAISMPTVLGEFTDAFDNNGNPSFYHEASEGRMDPGFYEDKRDEEHPFNFSSQYFDAELQKYCDELEKAK